MQQDLPTFDRPKKAISGRPSSVQCIFSYALLTNSAVKIFIDKRLYVETNMGKSKSTFIPIGGGELKKAEKVVDLLVELLKRDRDSRVLILTVATNRPESAIDKYNALFRSKGVKHVDAVDVSERKDALSK